MRTTDERSAPAADAKDWALETEACRIELSRGEVTSLFFARGEGDGKLTAVCEPSTSFRWRGPGAPDTPEARLAHYELVARLRADGWAKTGDGDEWYASEFTRSRLVPHAGGAVEAPEPDVIEVPDAQPVTPALPPQPRVRSRPQRDAWRYAAAVGLLAAVALLAWLLLHG